MPSPGKGERGDAAGVDAYQRLIELACTHKKSTETLEQCFARLYASGQYSDLIKMPRVSIKAAYGEDGAEKFSVAAPRLR